MTTTNGERSATSAPKPPLARRKRRAAVERMLTAGASVGRIVDTLGHMASPTTLRKDARSVRARWRREDKWAAGHMKAAKVRQLQRLARKAEKAGEWAAATGAIGMLARIKGWITAANVSATAVASATTSDDRQILLPVSLMFGGQGEKVREAAPRTTS